MKPQGVSQRALGARQAIATHCCSFPGKPTSGPQSRAGGSGHGPVRASGWVGLYSGVFLSRAPCQAAPGMASPVPPASRITPFTHLGHTGEVRFLSFT